MQNKSKTLRFIAKIDVFSGLAFTFLGVLFFVMKDSIFGQAADDTVPLVFVLIGLFSFLNVPILYFLARKIDEKNPSPVEY
jgi:hypothetical protein